MEKDVYTLGLITLQDQKIKSNNYHFLCVGRLINFLVLFLLQHLSWIERYSTMKIGRFFFVWVYKTKQNMKTTNSDTKGQHLLQLHEKGKMTAESQSDVRYHKSHVGYISIQIE